MDDKYDVEVKKTVDDSNIWEGLFLELNHNSLQNKIIIGNVYKPPSDNNSARNINAFKSEIEPILQEISISNSEALICGDYNIYLLKINGEAHFSEFSDTMFGHSFYPKITLPTRLNRTSGATLIDNIYYKYSLLMHCIKIKSRAKSLLNEQYVFVGGNISFLCVLSCISEEA